MSNTTVEKMQGLIRMDAQNKDKRNRLLKLTSLKCTLSEVDGVEYRMNPEEQVQFRELASMWLAKVEAADTSFFETLNKIEKVI